MQQYTLPVHLAGRDVAVLGATTRDQVTCVIASAVAGVLATPLGAPS